jgi:hypothetical protein
MCLSFTDVTDVFAARQELIMRSLIHLLQYLSPTAERMEINDRIRVHEPTIRAQMTQDRVIN